MGWRLAFGWVAYFLQQQPARRPPPLCQVTTEQRLLPSSTMSLFASIINSPLPSLFFFSPSYLSLNIHIHNCLLLLWPILTQSTHPSVRTCTPSRVVVLVGRGAGFE